MPLIFKDIHQGIYQLKDKKELKFIPSQTFTIALKLALIKGEWKTNK